MNTLWVLTKREFRAFFDSLIAYILLILFLGISGFFTFFMGHFQNRGFFFGLVSEPHNFLYFPPTDTT